MLEAAVSVDAENVGTNAADLELNSDRTSEIG